MSIYCPMFALLSEIPYTILLYYKLKMKYLDIVKYILCFVSGVCMSLSMIQFFVIQPPNVSVISSGQTSNVPMNQSDEIANITSTQPALVPNITFSEFKELYELRYGRAAPIGLEKWFQFAQERQCKLEGNYDPIYQDLSPFFAMSSSEFKKRIQLVSTTRRMNKMQVQNGHSNWKLVKNFASLLPDLDAYFNGADEPRILWNKKNTKTLQNMNSNITSVTWREDRAFYDDYIKETCFIPSKMRPWFSLTKYHGIMTRPHIESYTKDLLPLFSHSIYGTCFGDIRFPNEHYYKSYEGDYKIAERVDTYTWESKKPLAYWRGATTGGWYDGPEELSTFHRHRMLKQFQNNPLFDIAFGAIVACPDQACREKTRNEYKIDVHRNYQYLTQYKYLIDIDGNSFSRRWMHLMQSNSLVFKVSQSLEIFEHWLKPYVHYIPVEMDMSDLVEKIEWAIKNDKLAKQIAENGRDFVEKHVREEDLDCYVFRLFTEYANLIHKDD